MTTQIIDVRETDEFKKGHVDKSLNIPLDNIREDFFETTGIQKDTVLIIYCRSGNRSEQAISILKSLGYQHLINGINQQITKRIILRQSKPL